MCSWQSSEALGQIWCHEAVDCQASSPVLDQTIHYLESNSSPNQMETITCHFWLISVCQREVSDTELAFKLLSLHLSLNYSCPIPSVPIIPAQGWIWWRSSSHASGNRRWITPCATLPCYVFTPELCIPCILEGIPCFKLWFLLSRAQGAQGQVSPQRDRSLDTHQFLELPALFFPDGWILLGQGHLKHPAGA